MQEGHWILTTNFNFVLHISCLDQNEPDIYITAPIAFIHLQNGCKGTSPYIIIPPFFYKKTTFKLVEPKFQMPSNLSLWSFHSDIIQQALIKIPHKLPQTADVSHSLKHLVSTLHTHLSEVRNVQTSLDSHKSQHSVYFYVFIVTGIILVIMVFSIIIYCKYSLVIKSFMSNALSAKSANAYYNAAQSTVTLNELTPTESAPPAVHAHSDSVSLKLPVTPSVNPPSAAEDGMSSAVANVKLY